MVSRIDCEERGMIFVEGHKDRKGRYVHAHCRKRFKDRFLTDLDREEQRRNRERGSSISNSSLDVDIGIPDDMSD